MLYGDSLTYNNFSETEEAQQWLNDNYGDERVRALVDSVTTHPQFRALDKVTNPDGITVGGNVQLPGVNVGGSVTLTRNFDVITSNHVGYDPSTQKPLMSLTFPGFFREAVSQMRSRSAWMNGINANATWILESEVSPEQRRNFFTGLSGSGTACAFRGCIGATAVPDANGGPTRWGVNVGATVSPVPNVSDNISYGTFRFNIHCRVFGQTSQSGPCN